MLFLFWYHAAGLKKPFSPNFSSLQFRASMAYLRLCVVVRGGTGCNINEMKERVKYVYSGADTERGRKNDGVV